MREKLPRKIGCRTGNTILILLIGIVPAWEFYGYAEYDDGKSAPLYYNQDLQVWDKSYAENTSVCTVNALDGSVICE